MGRLGNAIAERSNLATPEKWVIEWFKGGTKTPAGIHVTEDTALHYSPFFAGVRIISEDLGSLPFPLYRRLQPRGKQRATDHPLYPILHDAANPIMSAQTFRETLTGHAIMWGGGYAEIVRRRGVVRELWPLRPDRMRVKFNPKTRRLTYRYEDYTNGIVQTFLPDEIYHVHGLGFDGTRGYSVLELARNSIGAGVAAETYGAAFFGNSARSPGVLTHPGTLSEKARDNLRRSWESQHRGLENAHRIAILEEGLEWHEIGIPPEDAQFLETRRFDVHEMARWLRLPPHMLAELGRATWNNIESEKIDYVTKSLRTWLTRWESAVWMRLLDSEEQDELFARHVVEGLLRGDSKSRFESYRIGREIGVYSADDILELEDRNPLPDGRGEVYFVPLNWVPAPKPGDGSMANGGTQDTDPDAERMFHVERQTRSAASRRRIAQAFEPLCRDVEERMAKIERNQVRRLIRKHFDDPERVRNSIPAFTADVSDLYETEIFDQAVERWRPLMTTFAAQIFAEASDEVNWQKEINLDNWIGTYVASHASYRGRAAAVQLIDIAEKAAGPADAAQTLNAKLEHWVKARPETVARKETIQMANGGAREVWRTAGVRKMRWISSGGDCPYCATLNGKVVGIEQHFVPAGTDIEGKNGDTMSVTNNTFHPPVHAGCDCMVVAE